jgi:hypothetical protein
MPIEITPQLVSSIVCEIIRYRDRVDTILALKEASEGLPFLLPPAPADEAPHLDDLVRFFATPVGQTTLILHDLADDYELFLTDPRSLDNRAIAATRQRLFRLYFEAAPFRPVRLGPDAPVTNRSAGTGPEVGLRLAWYVVESQRLSRHPAFVNLLLATTDTLLDIVGQNAGIFVRHPRTRGIVESLLSEFALKGDLEDQSFLLLFRRLLGSTVLAFGDHPGKIRNQTALKVFYGALTRVRKTLGRSGDDLAAAMISADGFEQFLVALTTEVARDPAFLIRDRVASDVVAAMLTRICRDYPLLLNDSKALLGVVEAGLGAAATSTATILDPGPGGSEPLLSSLLAAILREVGTCAQKDALVASIANGEVVPGLYRAALLAVATTPLKFAKVGEANRFAADLVNGMAKLLASQEMKALGSTSTLQLLAIETLRILSHHPRLLAGHNVFATSLLASVLQAGTVVMADGLEREDILEMADQALVAATANAALLRLETRLGEAILAAGRGIASANLQDQVDAKGRMAILNAALRAISVNPPVWSRLQEQKIVEPLVRGLLVSLKADGSGLLTGKRFVETASRLFHLLARRGQLLIEKKIDLPALQAFLTMTVKRLERELGRTIDGEAQPYLIEKIATAIIDAPARLKQRPDAFIDEILPSMLVDLDRLWGKV